ncbi:hypothetical protein IAG44_19205 [Streptomyces roseirectus]|uniref:Uncharacterized protein n=1 Tax=Streptomyces roseirectus TaxID=2768066 RepID=A0A7H0IEY5_9ACTN|nr:hypothetical protein [Streptomyces roseirectus]QNP71351.1 hypothetical protein IAG44_19205 [Streptomyces roseirectus]
MIRPRPEQITEVQPAYAVPPPALPRPPAPHNDRQLTPVRSEFPQQRTRRGRTRRAARRLLTDDTFWSGVLTAFSVATLIVVIAATV